MKALPFLLALLLTQCAAPGGGTGLRGYRLGLMKGGADAAAGLDRVPSRYASEYSSRDRDDFFRGYEKGYHRHAR